jgi:hypothetical protein
LSVSIGPLLESALDAEDDVVTRRHHQPGAGRPAQAARPEEVGVDRVGVQLVVCPEVVLHQKGRLVLAEQANAPAALGKPAVVHIGAKNVVQRGRRRPVEHLVAHGKQQAAAGLGHLGHLVQHARPQLRHKRAFVDAVNQIGFHKSLASLFPG